jgi:prepilin-type N-terminal cleavage/methylation domain-containing protein
LDPSRRQAAAFTLVELLVVIVIIGILVSILIPAVGAVRKTARNAATSAALTTIATGLETFKADGRLGGQYPPSQSDYRVSIGPVVRSPYAAGAEIQITGAGLLVWALSGADLLGTPGFQTVGNAATWGQCTGPNYNNGPGDPTNPADLYALDPAEQQPVYPRSGPYVDISKLPVTRDEDTTTNVDFVVPAELAARKALGLDLIQRNYPMYLDAFGYPILYWRADSSGRTMASVDRSRTDLPRGIYWYEDNLALTDMGSIEKLVLSKAGGAHAIEWELSGGPWIPPNWPPAGYFQGYIVNKAVQARLEPSRADSYLLVSPGADGRYGTADDVTNFEHNGL